MVNAQLQSTGISTEIVQLRSQMLQFTATLSFFLNRGTEEGVAMLDLLMAALTMWFASLEPVVVILD